MKIPDQNAINIENGTLINFEVNTFIKAPASSNWTYHDIKAFDNGKEVGFLTIAYISEENKNEKAKDIINYLINKGNLDHENKNLNISTITMDDIINFNKNVINVKNMDEENILSFFKLQLKINHSEYYNNHLSYHYLKPEVHYVDVNEEYRRKGIGRELYKIAIDLCNLNGMNLYQSTTQSEDAVLIWDRMKKDFKNCNSYEYKNYNKETKNRFYFGNEEPKLNFENGLNKLTLKSLKKNKIKVRPL